MKVYSVLMLALPIVIFTVTGYFTLSFDNTFTNRQRLLASPFASFAVLLVISGNGLYYGLKIGTISVIFFVVMSIAPSIRLYYYRVSRSVGRFHIRSIFSFDVSTYALLFITITVIALYSFSYIAIGSQSFLGYDTRDAWNYTAQAQFFMDYPFSTALQDGNQNAYLPLAIWLKHDRVGGSVLQAWIATILSTGAKQAWGSASLFGPILLVFPLWLWAEYMHMNKLEMFVAVLFGATLPGLSWIYLENTFLANAVALPFLLMYPYILVTCVESPTLSRFFLAIGVFFSFLYIYGDMILILIALSLIVALWQSIIAPKTFIRNILLVSGIIFLGVVAVPSYIPTLYSFYIRAFAQLPSSYPPDGLTVSGFARIFYGNLFAGRSDIIIHSFNLLVMIIAIMSISGIILSFLDFRSSGLICILSSVALPIYLCSNPQPLTYQYYKALASLTPLLPLGLGYLSTELGTRGRLDGWVIKIGLCVLALCGLGLSVAGTINSGERYIVRYAGMKNEQLVFWTRYLEKTRDQNVLITVDNPSDVSWLAYAARYDHVWIRHDFYGAGWNAVFNGKYMKFLDLSTLPDHDVLTVAY